MKFTITLFISFLSMLSWASDCTSIKPFTPNGGLKAKVNISHLYWKDGVQTDEPVCSKDVEVLSYDVRGREEEAFLCLHPSEAQFLSCPTQFNNEEAQIFVVPATWIRNMSSVSLREYRMHAYISKSQDPDFYNDIFSRTLSENLEIQNIIIEGALKTGPNNLSDGYFIRVKFEK